MGKGSTFAPGLLALSIHSALTLQAAQPFDYDSFLKSAQVPPDFALTLAAGEPVIRFPMFACFDEEGGLYVAESSGKDLYAGLKQLSRDCRVSRLEDADGDGFFEKGTVFQSNVTFPMGLAWHDGRLYLADPPDLIALTDTDGDGRSDKRETILTGFGHSDNGSLHGLAFGPDGLLYFTMGEPDGWKLPRGDGSFLEGAAGALFRCRPDGSKPEVISRGFVNLVEIEFMRGGEFIGTDNWFQKPAGGYRDALVDCAPGGLYPYAPDRGTPLPRTGVTMPPLRLLPAVAHSGLIRPRGSGLPNAWRDSVFVAEHNTRRISRHDLRRNGSTFASFHGDLILGKHPDFHPSDVLEDADGSLLIVDTGGWYVDHCPTGRIRDSRAPGGIYRVRWSRAPKLPDPRGQQLNWASISAPELAEGLLGARHVVAARAASELVRRGDVDTLSKTLRSEATIEARLHALWSLSQINDSIALRPIREQLDASNPSLVTAAARALSARQDKIAGDALARLLDSTNAPIRRASAEALAACGSLSLAPRLVSALVKAIDEFEEHACVAALLSLADEQFARAMLKHESPRVRKAALNLLDQPPFETLRFADLVEPLGEEEPNLSATARRLLERHPNWADEGLPWLGGQLALPLAGGEEAALAGLLTAFQSNPGVRRLISRHIDPKWPTPDDTRSFLFNLLPALTAQPPEKVWLQAVPGALANPALRSAAMATLLAYPQPELEPLLSRLAEDAAIPATQRLLAARVSARAPVLTEGVFLLALRSLDAQGGAIERLGAIDLLSRARLSKNQLNRLIKEMSTVGATPADALLPFLPRLAGIDTRSMLIDFFAAKIRSGWSPDRGTLDKVLGLFPESSPERASMLAAWEKNSAAKLGRLTDFKSLLSGGDSERGREWFVKATCEGCHRIGERGGIAGPELTRVGAIRSGEDLLESILFPSSSFSQGYATYSLKRKDGEEISGLLVAEDASAVSLRDATGAIHRTRATEIETLEEMPSSSMPEGLEQLLTREQFRDLLAFLQSLK